MRSNKHQIDSDPTEYKENRIHIQPNQNPVKPNQTKKIIDSNQSNQNSIEIKIPSNQNSIESKQTHAGIKERNDRDRSRSGAVYR